MVGIGFVMMLIGFWSGYRRLRGSLYDARWLQRTCVLMMPSGFIAVLAGWITTEVGRQPWTIYGLLRTADSVSPIGAEAVAASLLVFIFVYFSVFGAGIFYILRLMAKSPDAGIEFDSGPTRAAGITPMAVIRKLRDTVTLNSGGR